MFDNQQYSAHSGGGSLDPTYNYIKANRDAYGRVIHLFGDSLFRGYALGRFPDTMTVEEASAEPLWELRSPASMLNLLFEGNVGGFSRDPVGAVTSGEIVAGYAGNVGQPDIDLSRRVSKNIEKSIEDGIIAAGDVVAFIDAGDHNGNPDEYQENWLTLRRSVHRARVRVVMFDMFDYVMKSNIGGKPADNYRYGVPFKGSSGMLRNHNEATHAAAAAQLTGFGSCRLVQMRAMMDRFRADMLDDYQVPVLHFDGIHPNIWGQWLMAIALVDADAGIGRYAAHAVMLDLVGVHCRRLGYGTTSPAWSEATARDVLTRCAGGAWSL